MSVPPVEDLGLLNVSLSFTPPLGVTKFVAIGGLHLLTLLVNLAFKVLIFFIVTNDLAKLASVELLWTNQILGQLEP